MEEEMRQGMMGADVQTTPVPVDDKDNPLINVIGDKVSDNLKNLNEQEMELITQLNVPQFRDFMSKVFGQEFGMVMQEAIPEPQAQPQPEAQPVSPQGENQPPMTGGGMMQPPSQ